MYLNEQQTESTRSLSDRIDLATKFKTYAEKFASENYQVTHNLFIFGHLGDFIHPGFILPFLHQNK